MCIRNVYLTTKIDRESIFFKVFCKKDNMLCAAYIERLIGGRIFYRAIDKNGNLIREKPGASRFEDRHSFQVWTTRAHAEKFALLMREAWNIPFVVKTIIVPIGAKVKYGFSYTGFPEISGLPVLQVENGKIFGWK